MDLDDNYFYLSEVPMLIRGKYLIGEVFYKGHKATLVYDLKKNESGIGQWLPEKLHLQDIILPISSFENTAVDWINKDVHDNLKEKYDIPENFVKHLEEDGEILAFYHIKK